MSDKTFPFTRALRQAVKRGQLADPEAAFDAEVQARIETSKALRAIRGSALPDSLSFFIPTRRDLTAGGAGAGITMEAEIEEHREMLPSSLAQASTIAI